LTSNYEQLINESCVLDWEMDIADPDACYFQGYTAGTTGFPKGCVNPHREFADCLRRLGVVYGITDADIELVAAPLFHEAPALFALTQIMRGGSLVIPRDSAPETLMAAIQDHKVTWAFMVPTMWTSFVTSEAIGRFDLRSLRMGISGGSALQTSTKHAIIEKMPATGLNEFYGGTEVGLVTNLAPEDQSRKVRSVGRPVQDMYVELRGEDGQPIEKGEIGEIHVGGATLIREYYKNPEATQSARSHGGFFSLGDMGRFDDEGYLYIVDRKKDMIISGGENIYPNDIEDVLYQYPGVQMVAVVGAPDDLWGEIVVAVVVPKPGQQLDEQQLIAHCKASLSPFKVPKKVDFRTELPLSAFGKILRREVKETYWEGRTARV
jgi:acyl-CoA synthetase (AMP-forming)/AMP-acid ligase II